jgi:hypothetical protein
MRHGVANLSAFARLRNRRDYERRFSSLRSQSPECLPAFSLQLSPSGYHNNLCNSICEDAADAFWEGRTGRINGWDDDRDIVAGEGGIWLYEEGPVAPCTDDMSNESDVAETKEGAEYREPNIGT